MTEQPTAPATPGGIRPDSLNQLGAAPADPGNVNAPGATPLLSQSGNVTTDPSTGLPTATITVNGKLITLTLNSGITAGMPVGIPPHGAGSGSPSATKGNGADTVGVSNFQTVLNSIGQVGSNPGWYANSTQRQKYINQMYQAGLISTNKSPSAAEVASAWQLVVQEAALQTADFAANGTVSNPDMTSPDDVLAKAAQTGWNSMPTAKQAVGDVGVNGTGNLNNSTQTVSNTDTIYKSYVDPATAMGTLADSYFRLMGRNPTSTEYKAFLNTIYAYQNEENTGKLESTSKGASGGQAIDPSTGQPVDQSGTDSSGSPTGGTNTQTSTVEQRGIATRGVQFLSGQQALASPEEGAYQAATTYFNAFIKALGGPASGMGASGPTTTIP